MFAASTGSDYVPDDFDHEFAMLLMTLSFFSSRTIAEAYMKELGRSDLEDAAKLFRRVFPGTLAEFARLGRRFASGESRDQAGT